MRLLVRAILLGLCFTAPALADAPKSSIRPVIRPAPSTGTSLEAQARILAATAGAFANPLRPLPRPVLGAPATDLAQQAQARAAPDGSITLRPRARPFRRVAALAPPDPLVSVVARSFALRAVPRPEPRPRLKSADPLEKVETVAAIRILPGKSAVIGRKGSVCGDPDIKGEVLAPITSRVRGCGVDAPVRITSVSGVKLSTPATIDCPTARALNDWVSGALKPAFGWKNVAGLQIMGSYSCRSRNNVRGAPISEHGRGKAVDVGAILLAGGKSVSVSKDWFRAAGKPMRKAYKAACGTFGTTLSPDADRYHRDHMHFDTARQRGGAYCR